MKTALTLLILIIASLAVRNTEAYCFTEAGLRYKINPLVLYAIAKQESGFNPKAHHLNLDGSYDFSLMQINSSWLAPLAKYGIHEADLLKDACLSVQVGAWILAQNMNTYAGRPNSYWSAVGAYNAGTSSKNDNKRMSYAWLIYKHMASAK